MRVQSSAKVSSFKDLQVWQKAQLLTKLIYSLSKEFPKDELYSFTSQIRRAALSVVSNIAEGSSKRSTREFIRFINISYGSLAEIEAQAIIASDLGYLNDTSLAAITEAVEEIGRMLNALQNKLHEKLNSELLDS